jgi:hypothetical protein
MEYDYENDYEDIEFPRVCGSDLQFVTFTTKIVGSHFINKSTKNFIKSLPNRQRLKLRRDFDNKYDSNAIGIHYDWGYKGEKGENLTLLGYVPREDNQVLSELMKDGRKSFNTYLAGCYKESGFKDIFYITIFGSNEDIEKIKKSKDPNYSNLSWLFENSNLKQSKGV